jgi:hypothetical protein
MQMRYLILLIVFFDGIRSNAQKLDVDLFGGISNYQGDLQPIFFTVQNASPGGAVILKYGINANFFVRAGFSFGSIAGYDSKNKKELQSRILLPRLIYLLGLASLPLIPTPILPMIPTEFTFSL